MASRKPFFEPGRDIPDLSSKVIIVTGGNIGLGKQSILQLARHNPLKIYMGSRSKEKAQAAIAEIKQTVPGANIIFLEMDLASFSSIQDAAKTFLSQNDRLDILINNAGIMAVPPGLTKDGYEIQFGTNHMGHALLIKLLLPVMERTVTEVKSDPRIVIVSAEAYKWAPKGGLILSQNKTDLANVGTLRRYGQSKLANLLYAEALAERYPNIKAVSLHPGVVRTNLGSTARKAHPIVGSLIVGLSKWFMASPEAGALTQLWASTTSSEDIKSGAFYTPVGVVLKGPKIENEEALVKELWEWTEKELMNYTI
jgi:NAD(P)-dependent dehydrogenase (short-subunit alcohol dehydrogenase family)